ncbi:circularly permuted type 2 ATP-grasp protein [Fulvivirga sedimenti]|uniref:Circularly permuted type 2 ATP-grasp protein n=1 Tax=Fulvivirga sedimenti TaxID=2879465 RepID=A0A9X1HWN4_9BACT|nr:circularly permuted type 2 ATP-grasp protein [Fulvivirga sedimenti]MCA6075544.1 circularly permuted type 2 ATP-grasp protein [Fulvivirga sedimenti]MCA6076721.1 circularly permuted type 2 ATP-grasp protein [Fulvivirga sedimenti]MCA6077849.1 circularly permuted type 2 ATP-grasp protein [Fulvivirga sedimenti]
MFEAEDKCRPQYDVFRQHLNSLSRKKLQQLQHSTEKSQLSMGMTFNVYHESEGVERILHLDIIPRIISGEEWERVEEGLRQRIKALNLFLEDIYNDRNVLRDGIVPEELILGSKDYLEPCIGLHPPKGIWCHITGTDLVRNKDGRFYVLEDNLRCPSGVSYMLENREIVKKVFPQVFQQIGVRPVVDYPAHLFKMLQYLSPKKDPVVVVLTPGVFNSAYFEHSYLAQQMGVELVTGQDLVVKNNKVFMITTHGLSPVDVIYRRIDDTFLDPEAFNPNSMLGIPGLFEAYKAGNVALANAPGTGVADDKAVYAYVPRLIKYYLDEEPILENVPTYLCREEEDRNYVLENIADLVVKETNAAGGYGMLIGPKSTPQQHELFREKIRNNPNNYIAQPTLSLSTVPTLDNDQIEGRHVDLRPYILYGPDIHVIPGALTRVALVKGSLVVNSSQGGGSKDTWVLYKENEL